MMNTIFEENNNFNKGETLKKIKLYNWKINIWN